MNAPTFSAAQTAQIFNLPTVPANWLARKLNLSGVRAARAAALTAAGKDRRSLAKCKASHAHPKATDGYRAAALDFLAFARALPAGVDLPV